MKKITVGFSNTYHPSTGWTGEWAYANFELSSEMSDEDILYHIDSELNRFSAGAESFISEFLPENRTHTTPRVALGELDENGKITQYGDTITIEDEFGFTTYETDDFGWRRL